MPISPVARWIMGSAIVIMLVAVPYIHYRNTYQTSKRLRVVTTGKFYRSGCMTAEGFRKAIQKYGIRTVLNLQDEARDPNLPDSTFARSTTTESELCRQMGVNFEFIHVKLINPETVPANHPDTIDQFLALCDKPNVFPMLIHCRAGLHRTGCLTAVYRMEYEGWSREEAIRELKAHGFGEWASSAANDYITQYVLSYQPRPRGPDGTIESGFVGLPVRAAAVGALGVLRPVSLSH